jgi:hypothetical protein
LYVGEEASDAYDTIGLEKDDDENESDESMADEDSPRRFVCSMSACPLREYGRLKPTPKPT